MLPQSASLLPDALIDRQAAAGGAPVQREIGTQRAADGDAFEARRLT